jgi:nitroreductase
MKIDKYQERYLAHQKRKAESLTSTYGKKVKPVSLKESRVFFNILKRRSSQRVFNNEPIDINPILEAIETVPNSCNRRGVYVKIITERDKKDLLSGLLVGGTGWCYRGQAILLLVADMTAYKNPAERQNMPFLDAGVIIQTVYLASEALNYGCCYVNPNIREQNQEFFKQRFLNDNELFCGALVIGKYNLKH